MTRSTLLVGEAVLALVAEDRLELGRAAHDADEWGLLTLDRAGFYGAGFATYPLSAAFIRYLIDGEDGALAEGFFTFLKRIAAGMRPIS